NETLAQHGLDGCGHSLLAPPPPPLRPLPSLVPGPVFRCAEPRRRGQGVCRPQPPASVPQQGPSHAHTVAREPAQLILLGAHGAARVEGGVRRPLASPHGRHRLREWEVLDLAREEFWQESKLPWARNPPKGFIGFRF
ncbi:tRNA (guanine-N-7) methyltransferase, partial [Zea mays]